MCVKAFHQEGPQFEERQGSLSWQIHSHMQPFVQVGAHKTITMPWWSVAPLMQNARRYRTELAHSDQTYEPRQTLDEEMPSWTRWCRIPWQDNRNLVQLALRDCWQMGAAQWLSWLYLDQNKNGSHNQWLTCCLCQLCFGLEEDWGGPESGRGLACVGDQTGCRPPSQIDWWQEQEIRCFALTWSDRSHKIPLQQTRGPHTFLHLERPLWGEIESSKQPQLSSGIDRSQWLHLVQLGPLSTTAPTIGVLSSKIWRTKIRKAVMMLRTPQEANQPPPLKTEESKWRQKKLKPFIFNRLEQKNNHVNKDENKNHHAIYCAIKLCFENRSSECWCVGSLDTFLLFSVLLKIPSSFCVMSVQKSNQNQFNKQPDNPTWKQTTESKSVSICELHTQ